MIRLRHYLERVAEGEYELDVSMYSNDDTVQAIEEYMKEIVRQAASRVEMIDAQSHQLVEAERNRVMVETVGAACHHLGQPATAILGGLELLKRSGRVDNKHDAKLLDDCEEAAIKISKILSRLQKVGVYETESYLEHNPVDTRDADARILKI